MGAPGARLTDPARAVRLAVRTGLADLPRDGRVAVAVSGGRDSLALVLAAVAVAPALGVHVGALTVDHAWHPTSDSVADAVARAAAAAGCRPVEVLHARDAGDPPGAGPEADARHVRYELLDSAAGRHGLTAVLLGHTLDDQAETVLLGLARGSGARSLAGMPARRGRLRRPLLGLRRRTVHDALPALIADALPAGLPDPLPWEDPANSDPRHARSRARRDLLPALEGALGAGAVTGLARSADLLREDADALDALAATVLAEVSDATAGGPPVARLAAQPDALLARVLRLLAARAGAGALTAAHTRALVALVRAGSASGAGPVALPGGVAARRTRGRLLLGPADPTVDPAPAGRPDPQGLVPIRKEQ